MRPPEPSEKRPLDLTLELGVADGGSQEELASLAWRLRRELLELDIDSARVARDPTAPPGAKGIEAAVAGKLILTVARSAGLHAVVGALRAWIARDTGRTAKLEIGGDTIELSRISEDDQRRLIDHWMERHAAHLE